MIDVGFWNFWDEESEDKGELSDRKPRIFFLASRWEKLSDFCRPTETPHAGDPAPRAGTLHPSDAASRSSSSETCLLAPQSPWPSRLHLRLSSTSLVTGTISPRTASSGTLVHHQRHCCPTEMHGSTLESLCIANAEVFCKKQLRRERKSRTVSPSKHLFA